MSVPVHPLARNGDIPAQRLMKTSWLDIRRCMNCGSAKYKQRYADYMDGHTLLECESVCGNCGNPVYVFAYGAEEHYTFTIRELLKNLAL